MRVTLNPGNPAPIVVNSGEIVTATMSAGATGTVAVAGEAVADTIVASSTKTYGPYSVQREVVFTITAGTAVVFIGTSKVTSSEGRIVGSEGTIGIGRGGKSRLASAISAYKAGLRTRPPLIIGVGDSNFTGEGAGSGGTVPKLSGAAAYGPMERIKDHTPTIGGLVVRNTAFFGDGNSQNNAIPLNEYDPRLTLGSGWSMDNSPQTIGGNLLKGDPSSTGYFQFNAGSALTDVEIYYSTASFASSSVGVYASDNTLIGTINSNGSNVTSVASFSSAKFADGIVKLKNNDASQTAYIQGMVGWNSAERSILVVRGSWSAAKVADFSATTNAWTGIQPLSKIKPDATILCLTINDITGATVAATYNTNLSAVAAICVRWGDLILSTGGNGSAAAWTTGTGASDIEFEMNKVAALYGAGTVSMHREWGSWAATNAIGYEYDTNHRTRLGYYEQARKYAHVILGLVA